MQAPVDDRAELVIEVLASGYCYYSTLYILFLSHPTYVFIFLCLVAVCQLELKS